MLNKMSYQYYVQNMHHLMAMGVYNIPMHVATLPLTPVYLPIQIVQPEPEFCKDVPSAEGECNEKDDEDERTLFCANLDENVTEELLYEVFLQAGPIQRVYIPKDNAGKRRSYGFVTYKYSSSTLYAMRLYQGLVLFDKRLDIKFQGRHRYM